MLKPYQLVVSLPFVYRPMRLVLQLALTGIFNKAVWGPNGPLPLQSDGGSHPPGDISLV